MSDTNTETTDNAAAIKRVESEDKGTFGFGGRSRRDKDKKPLPAFQKIERAVVFANLPEESQRFLIRYGIRQYLQDGANKADSDATFAEAIDARIENLANADFSRERGEPAPTNDPAVLARAIARSEVAELIRTAKAADSTFALTKEQRAAAVDALVESESERLLVEAKRQIDARVGAASKGAALLASLLKPKA